MCQRRLYHGVMAAMRVRGDGGSGFVVGAVMFASLFPGLLALRVFGDMHPVAILTLSLGGVLALLSPIPVFVAARLARQSIELVDGRLRVANHETTVETSVEQLEGLMLFDGRLSWAVVAFKIKGEWVHVDPRGLEREGVARIFAAIREARPDLAA